MTSLKHFGKFQSQKVSVVLTKTMFQSFQHVGSVWVDTEAHQVTLSRGEVIELRGGPRYVDQVRSPAASDGSKSERVLVAVGLGDETSRRDLPSALRFSTSRAHRRPTSSARQTVPSWLTKASPTNSATYLPCARAASTMVPKRSVVAPV